MTESTDMPSDSTETEQLVSLAARGNGRAMERLISRYRGRLRRMVAVRMDPRLARRIDPSDVVQEALAEASRKLDSYLQNEYLPFYVWLRKLAWGHLVRVHRRHILARRRSVSREEPVWTGISDESAGDLADQVAASATSPSARLVREEIRARVRSALDELAPRDRDILVMRHLEQLRVGEIAAILGISEGAVMMRRLRAFRRLCTLLRENDD